MIMEARKSGVLEISEFSDNYPVKTGPETISFIRILRDTVEMGKARLRTLISNCIQKSMIGTAVDCADRFLFFVHFFQVWYTYKNKSFIMIKDVFVCDNFTTFYRIRTCSINNR